MAQSDDNLLDLSDWPAPPAVTTLSPRQSPSRSLPPRPVRSRTLPLLRLNLKGSAIAAVVLGVGLLVVPVGGCGSVVRAWASTPLPAPADTPPRLDDAEPARDAEAVRSAQAALAAWHPAASSAPRATPVTTSRTVNVSKVSAREVAAAEAAVEAAQRDVDADQSELDRLLAEQEASSDPASYDGQVAAAREELDRAVASLDEARRDLATARSRTEQVVVTTTASPRPAPRPSAAPTTARVGLVAQLADARQLQAAHLAARQKAVASWRTGYQAETARVSAHNDRVKDCAGRAAVPGSAGVGLAALGAGALLWRRFASRRLTL
ncbi:MAG: hypothetical protein M3P04_14385 [Actinomycetota bacterium]|nr:hypothetical protein [Actinomycetota bacterium]